MILDSFNIKPRDCVEGYKQVNQINFEHVGFAVFMQLVIGLVFGDWFAGACFGSAFYIGREITQAEYRAIEHTYNGIRANMPWYSGFMPSSWTVKSLLDWILPTITCLIILGIVSFI